MDIEKKVVEAWKKVKKKRPLVHHITNPVVANDSANVLLALGAYPVMAQAREEVEEMVAQSQALVINLGVPTPELVESAILAGREANRQGIPVVFDPVGVGATRFRTISGEKILDLVEVALVRGNPGEISALLGHSSRMRGVNFVGQLEDLSSLVKEAGHRWKATVAVTGRIDYVSDGKRLARVSNGHPWLTRVTGTGCMVSSLCAALTAVESDLVLASATALGLWGVCGEIAATRSSGIGSFRVSLFDVLSEMSADEFLKSLKIEVD
ncbi:MAG: hydroxyethylthiazole kinase [Candidatus Atribacteria bacterium]|nr:hydroxyethylthiazole kinase [Candidatus Atribacteria bacterium]